MWLIDNYMSSMPNPFVHISPVDPLPQHPHGYESWLVKDDSVDKPGERVERDNHVSVPLLVADQITTGHTYDFHSK